MNPQELRLEHIAPYLPYGLKCLNQHLPDIEFIEEELKGISNHIVWSGKFDAKHGCNYVPISAIKPILKPLIELDIDFEVNTPEYLQGCCYSYVQKLISEHYDVFGLIPKGLAIDFNQLKLTDN